MLVALSRIPILSHHLREKAREETRASSLELLIFFPLLLLITLVTVQVALSWYGNEVAMTAARETARTLRTGAHDPGL